MRRLFITWRLWIISPLLAVAAALLAFCSWHNVWSRDEWFVHQYMVDECHPAWREYHFLHVCAGDDVESVIARTQPSVIMRKGNRVMLEYYQNYDKSKGGAYWTGLTAEARDGKMVSAYAYSCEWTRQFFDTVGQEDAYFAFAYRRLSRGGAISSIYGY